MLTPEEQTELQRLVQDHFPIRAIARRLGRDVKTIRRALGRRSPLPSPSKLAPYHPLIREWFAQDLRSPRILRELRARGYTPRERHIDNSAGLAEAWAEATLVRPGIALYGAHPPEPGLVEPVMALVSAVVALRAVPAGGTVSYGRRFRAARPSRPSAASTPPALTRASRARE